jgi:hypothetical protein
MEDRTWQLFTKAAASSNQRVRRQVTAQQHVGNRSYPFERIDLVSASDDGVCSCHPHAVHPRASTAA